MYRVAWLTFALLCVAHARVYDRCELARELTALGVRRDHLSTWVCIAYHESRFDTAANNPYSGDHGIFQISELYWCGRGKACGLPCSALRDDDISDDLDCALIVHEEHTRLQGNGFLAWVVYPQHCKHNTKKYLVDCDMNVKNYVPLTRSRGYNQYAYSYDQPNVYENSYDQPYVYENSYDQPYVYANSYDRPNVTTERQNDESVLPSYLSIGKIIRENYGKVLDQNRDRIDWYNYKYDNIDELQLPVFNQPSQHINLPPQTTTTTTTSAPRRTTTATTPYVPRIKVWRVIETNQFRKKQKFSDTNKQTTTTERYLQSTKANTALQLPSTTTRLQSVATTSLVPRPTTSLRPTSTLTTATYSTPTTSWLYRLPSSTTTYRPPTTITTTTYKPFTWPASTNRSPTTTSYKPITWSTTNKPIISPTTFKQVSWSTPNKPIVSTTTFKPFTWSTSNKPTTSTTTNKTPTPASTFKPFVWSTFKPFSTASVTLKTVSTTYRPVTTTTFLPSSVTTTPHVLSTKKPTTTWTWGSWGSWSSTTPKTLTTPSTAVTTKPSWYTFTSRTATTPATTKFQTFRQTRTTQPFTLTTKAQNNTLARTTQAVTYKPQSTTQKPKTTQSVFDLYLNPTKATPFPKFEFSFGGSARSIIDRGTPTSATVTRARGDNNSKKDIKI